MSGRPSIEGIRTKAQVFAANSVIWDVGTRSRSGGPMRAKAVLATLFVVCVTVSSAVAAPPPGKGKPPSTE